jgi:cyclase
LPLARKSEHLRAAYAEGHADAAIVAGLLHTGETTIARLKQALAATGVPVRRL